MLDKRGRMLNVQSGYTTKKKKKNMSAWKRKKKKKKEINGDLGD